MGIGFSPPDAGPTVIAEQLDRVPIDAPAGQEPGRPMGQLFPVMAVLLAQVLYLDQATEESSR